VEVHVELLQRVGSCDNGFVIAIRADADNLISGALKDEVSAVDEVFAFNQQAKANEPADNLRIKDREVVTIDAGDRMPITPLQQQSRQRRV
jgi:hypothetical protein